MAVVKINASQFSNTFCEGITLVYHRVNKEGEDVNTAIAFTGKDYAPDTLDQTDVFKAWRKVFITYWETYSAIEGWSKDNAGIKTILTSKAPSRIVVVDKDAKSLKSFNVPGVLSSLGMKPSATDLKRLMEAKTDRERGRIVNKAATAAFDALKFRINFEKYETKPTEQTEQNTESKAS